MYMFSEAIPLFLYSLAVLMDSSCKSPLGLADSLIPDSGLSSSLPLSQPQQARLNNPHSAWCFNYSEVYVRPPPTL